MSALAPWRWTVFPAGVACLLLAGGPFAPAARAACGDYVTLAAHPAPAAPAGQDTAHHFPHTPCTGPMCDRSPASPVSATPVVLPVSAERWGCSDLVALPPLAAPGGALPDDPVAHPV